MKRLITICLVNRWKGEIMNNAILMSLIFLLILVCGCSHEFAWYKPEGTIEQARRDYDECICDTRTSLQASQVLFMQCMNQKGYRLYKPVDLSTNQITIEKPPEAWKTYWLPNDIAGK